MDVLVTIASEKYYVKLRTKVDVLKTFGDLEYLHV